MGERETMKLTDYRSIDDPKSEPDRLAEIGKRFESEFGFRAWVESSCALYSGRTVLFVDLPRRHEPAVFFDSLKAGEFLAAVRRARSSSCPGMELAAGADARLERAHRYGE